ncbi:hypothetical protein BJV78DRAFT_1351967 [Lactifluus subvellereus]|nr:hypothetical protein BJV78DRAFT_1351967 [Lactifluus subvellereus]
MDARIISVLSILPMSEGRTVHTNLKHTGVLIMGMVRIRGNAGVRPHLQGMATCNSGAPKVEDHDSDFGPPCTSWSSKFPEMAQTLRPLTTQLGRIDMEACLPSTTLVEQEKEIVLRVCENTLNNWRSDLGKAGYRVLVNFWETDPTMSNSAEARAEYVADSLSDLRFVYKEPDACFTRGAFCSPLISKVFARHLRKVSTEDEDYSPQIGALALATAAVERALTLFKTGEDALKVDRESNGARAGTRSNPWGEKAREFVKSTKRINDCLWDTIIEHAYVHLDVTDLDRLDENNSEDGSRVNPRAVIDLDCTYEIYHTSSNCGRWSPAHHGFCKRSVPAKKRPIGSY